MERTTLKPWPLETNVFLCCHLNISFFLTLLLLLQRLDGFEHSSPTASKPSSAKRAMYLDIIEGTFLLQYGVKCATYCFQILQLHIAQ